jgi:FADH2 O2-dependent halogenase
VGVSLDPRRHPEDPGVSPDQEFAALTARFPDLARQFDQAVPLREWECTGSVPYSSTRVAGNRWLLIGGAAGYVDPLFSRDLSDTAEVLHVLAWRLLRAIKDDDFSAERFSYVERLQQALLDSTDDLVSSAFISFSDYALWNAVFRIWACDLLASTSRLNNAMTAFLADRLDEHFTALEDVRYPRLLWPDHDEFKKLFGEMVTQCQAFDGGLISGGQAAAELFRAIEEAGFIPKNPGLTEPSERFIHSGPPMIAGAPGAGLALAGHQLTRLLSGNVRHVIRLGGQKRPVA